jgi:hypothetical protein
MRRCLDIKLGLHSSSQPFVHMPRMTVLLITGVAFLICGAWLLIPGISQAEKSSSCVNRISSRDALLVADPEGRVIYSKNETKKLVPASTLKVLTGLAAIHHLGESYRFHTEFYQDHDQLPDCRVSTILSLMTPILRMRPFRGSALPPIRMTPPTGHCVPISILFFSSGTTEAGLSRQNPRPR